ncbi:MAG: XdhC family protein [SAR202 cluster bacterium]|nr:XdhC family protein [SAR202 cluster bacterium]|tara:strand:- start:15097 stop:16242 length:1146 start_codon:yes stop_codon:yes gene_type:complete
MKDVFRETKRLLGEGQKAVLATVVKTKGSTPQKPGAKLLVREDGSGVGTLGGGCVEGDIWFAAKELLKTFGPSQFREYQLNEDLAAEEGLVCGGSMYFMIDPIYEPDEVLGFTKEIDDAYSGKSPVALATLISNPGENLLPLGSGTETGRKLFIREDGSTTGSLGSQAIDNDAISRSRQLMVHGANEYVVTENGTEYFIEGYTSPPKLILVGGGHVSKAISSLADKLGFHVYVTDDRIEFANKERFPESKQTIAMQPEDALKQINITKNSFIVVATRGHRYDSDALASAAKTAASYVGLLGSKRKIILIYEDLVKMGIPKDRITELRAPIGIEINARTPDEIAISILAEMLMFRLGGSGKNMKLDEKLVEKIFSKQAKVLN